MGGNVYSIVRCYKLNFTVERDCLTRYLWLLMTSVDTSRLK